MLKKSNKKGWVKAPGGTWDAIILFWSFIILVGLIYPYFRPDELEVIMIMRLADIIACGFFLADVIWRWLASPNKLRFWIFGWIDLISSIPYVPWQPVLRWGRVVSVIRIIRVARSSQRILAFFFTSRFNGTLVASGAMLLASIWLSSILILHFEKNAEGANIKTDFDALWWSVDTVSTVGYGTMYPVSKGGKITAMFLMIVGISLFSVNSGLWATWLIKGFQVGGDKLRNSKRFKTIVDDDGDAVVVPLEENTAVPEPAPAAAAPQVDEPKGDEAKK